MFPFKRPNPKAHYFMRLGSDMVLLEAHGPEQTPYLRCTGGLTGHPAHLHGMTVLLRKKCIQKKQTNFQDSLPALHQTASLILTDHKDSHQRGMPFSEHLTVHIV